VVMRTFYTSDLHFGHRLVAGKRGFGTVVEYTEMTDGEPVTFRRVDVSPEQVAEHDATLIANWNRIVSPGDQVWVLGDVTLYGILDVIERVSQLYGDKRLVLGNHDEGHPVHRGSHKKLALYRGVFESVHTSESVRLEGQDVLLSHFPYEGDGEGKTDRFAQWRLRDEGLAIIHGHTHLPGQLTRSDKGSLQIHVGLDAWEMKPVPEAIVMRMLRTGELLGDKLGRAS
jgi:calcineurin-like phosphoesterase family protein